MFGAILNVTGKLILLACFSSFLIISLIQSSRAEQLVEVELLEDNVILLDVMLDNSIIASSVDAFNMDNQILIAVEPLFDSLRLRYQITDSQLKVWKNDQVYLFELIDTLNAGNNQIAEQQLNWGSDGFYQYISIDVMERVFGVAISQDLTRLLLILNTQSNSVTDKDDLTYLFPVQNLELISERRRTHRFYTNSGQVEQDENRITIEDQYRLITYPHGTVNVSANLRDQQFNGAVQLVSDFLYHSSQLTLSKSDSSDLAASLSLSRFKKSPKSRILGVFDSYTVGDVSGIGSNLVSGSNRGVGMSVVRAPDGFRRRNLQTTIEEIAQPGWEAELFRNSYFIERTVVPGDGRLVFEDVELQYGLNNFEIRLYGPFGEEEVLLNRINIKQNALSEGQLAYSLNALDKNHTLLFDDNDAPYKLTNFGGSLDYGVSDRWQVGLGFASIDSDEQLVTVKNALGFDKLLFENDLALNQDGSYAQLTSISGNAFGKDSYNLIFESSEDFKSETINSIGDKSLRIAANYSLPSSWLFARFGADYNKTQSVTKTSFTNGLSKNIAGISLTHNLTVSRTEIEDGTEGLRTNNDLRGSLSFSGRWSDYLIGGQINYDPRDSDVISQNSSLNVRRKFVDPFDGNHYVSARYFPLNESGLRWQLNHNVSWNSNDFYMTFASSYNSNDDWNVQLGMRFFLSYDYHNNKMVMDKELKGGSATLDVHTYLDRHVNGLPDLLDYNLPDVMFIGSPRWGEFTSNEDGRTVLPGVYANSAFPFSAKWQEGSSTLNEDYVVYTHPGAYVDVNMPMFLITDLAGFVMRQQAEQEVGLRNVKILISDEEGKVVDSVETDRDGYYEILNLKPDNYRVQIAPEFLIEKGLTGDVVGIDIATSGRGGFIELPVLALSRISSSVQKAEETFVQFVVDPENMDVLVWDTDEEINKNYFTLPRKDNTPIENKYSLTQNKPKTEKVTEGITLPRILEQNKASIVQEAPVDNQISLEEPSNILSRKSLVQKLTNNKNALPVVKFRSVDTVSTPQGISIPAVSSIELGRVLPILGNTSSKWVIQFSANLLPIGQGEVAKYEAIGVLYSATKLTNDGVSYNCVLSQLFDNKQIAIEALNNSGLNGWVTQASVYDNFNPLN